MNEQEKVNLYKRINQYGSVELDVVPHDNSESYTVTVSHFEQAVSDIEGLMYENEVYF